MPTQKRKTSETLFTNGSFETLADAGRENMQAVAAATSIAAAGFGEVNKAWFEFAKSAFEHNGAAAEAILSAKNAAKAMELQADWARGAFDSYVSESSRISEMAVKTANDALAPIRARVDGVVGKGFQNAR